MEKQQLIYATFMFDKQTKQLLRKLAKASNRSMSSLLRSLVKKEAIKKGLIIVA